MAQHPPLPRICIALGFPDLARLLEHAHQEVAAGESFLEFRLDYLPSPERGAQAIRGFVEQYPDCIVLATCRRHQNHGKYNGSIEDQIRVLDAAVSAGAQAVDVEIETAEAAAARLSVLRGRARLIISYHNYEATPPLDVVLSRLTRIPADGYKVVTTARKPSDYGRLLVLARAHPRTPLVLLAMGELGFPSRVLSAAFGGKFTYAAPMGAQGTAAGQVCAHQLRHLYRIDKMSRSTKIYGIIADPVRQSISPAVHNRAFQNRRIEAVYLPFLVAPAHLRDFFMLAERLPVCGFSVTIPHKQRVLRYLDIVDPLARRIGAVNTVWRRAGKWRGANTDAAGVLTPLERALRLRNSTVLIAGNGGAARSAACALSDAGARIAVVGRNPDRVRALAKICGGEALVMDQLEKRYFDAVVHATPLGMFPNVEGCFFNGRIPGDVVLDMVYNPLETVLTREARAQGKTVIPGMQMFIEQAVKQFELWTGDQAPRTLMEKAALEALQC